MAIKKITDPGWVWPTHVDDHDTIDSSLATVNSSLDTINSSLDTVNSNISTLTVGVAQAAPSGAVTMFAGSAAPTGWLLCNGSAVSRTTYSALFAAIGTTFGAGDGSTTFNLPNLTGRVPLGTDVADGFPLAQAGGSTTATLTTAELPAHLHTVNSAGSHDHTAAGTTGSGHTHNFGMEWSANTTASGASTRIGDIDNLTGGGGTNATVTVNTTGSSHTHNIPTDGSHTHTTTNTGSGAAFPIVQPYLVLNFIIKT